MKVSVQEGGSATVVIGRKTWIKLAIFLALCAYGNAKLQCSRLDAVAESCRILNTRVNANSKRIDDLREDYHATTAQLRTSLDELTTYLRQRKAEAKPQ